MFNKKLIVSQVNLWYNLVGDKGALQIVKKYKVKPYQSYYHYKRRKMMIRNVICSCVLIGLIFTTLIVTKKIQLQDVTALFSVEEVEQLEIIEPVYLEQEVVKYDIHMAPTTVKGVYLPATHMSQLDAVIDIANDTEVNAIVMDVKTDYGYLTFSSDNPLLKGAVKEKPLIPNIEEVMDKLYEANIYPIARIVSFKDNVMTSLKPDQMVRTKDGIPFETSKGEKWLNPYDKRNWEYLLEISKEAIKVGFKEVQFDYIRFHESMEGKELDFPEGQSKIDIITEFTKYMYEHLHPYGVVVSADVFGTIITSKIDARIVGQDYKELAKHLDYICPMIYPSHYGEGSFGIPYPDLDPYKLISEVMHYSNSVIQEIPRHERLAQVRPWLQDFTASWLGNYQEYGDKQINEQIKATYDALGKEWLLWNGAGRYHSDGLEKE